MIRILYVDDNALDRELVRRALEGEDKFHLTEAKCQAEFEARLAGGGYDLVLSDFHILGFDGLQVLDAVRASGANIPVVIVTGTGSEETAVEAMRRGAADYVVKTAKHIQRLPQTILRCLEKQRLQAERDRAQAELGNSHELLRALAARLQAVREEERTGIARELHDELGQALTSLKMELSWMDKRIPNASAASLAEIQQKIAEMKQTIDATIQTVRKLCAELRPGVLDNLGLLPAIRWQAEEFQRRTGIACDCELPEEPTEPGPDRATAIFRIFQETLTNVARHARASRVRVRLSRSRSDLLLEIADNGKGIEQRHLTGKHSLGLVGMRERALVFGGEVQITGRPGNGTTLKVRMPIASDT